MMVDFMFAPNVVATDASPDGGVARRPSLG